MTPPATARSLPKRAVSDRSKIGARRAPRHARRISGPRRARSSSFARRRCRDPGARRCAAAQALGAPKLTLA